MAMKQQTKRDSRRKKWGIAVMALILALMVAACGNNSNGNNSGGGSATGNGNGGNAGNVAVEPDTAQDGQAGQDGQGEQGSDQAGSEAAAKTVATIHGEITIPAKPQRIVTDDYLGSLIALGVTPVGTPGLHLQNPYFAAALAGVEDIGDYGNSSAERMLALQPDVIISGNSKEELYEAYAKIAPTIVVPFGTLKNAHEEVTYFAELLGLEEEGAAWLQDYDKRIQAAKEKVDAAIPAEATFTIFEASENKVWTYGDNFGRGGQPIYQALGRKPKAEVAERIMEKQWEELSLEALDEYAGDYIILTVSESSGKTLADFQSDPVWGSLEAVKNGRLYLWPEERSWYYDPIAVLSQTEELAAWLAGESR